jgi:hypothetical protein
MRQIFWIPDQVLYILAEGQKYFGLRASRMTKGSVIPAFAGMTGGALLLQQRILISPLLGAQELDSDEPSLCVHQPGRTVNKECPGACVAALVV